MTSVFLHNLAKDVDADTITKLVNCAGAVIDIDRRDTFAIVTYANEASADCAVRNLHNHVMCNKLLTCKLSDAALRRRGLLDAGVAHVAVPCKRVVDHSQHAPHGPHKVRDGLRRVRPKPSPDDA